MKINKFWSKVIEEWILGDLDTMIKHEPRENKPSGNLNFSIALVTLAGIELAGSLLRGRKEGGKYGFEEFIKLYFPNFKNDVYRNIEIASMLYDSFRNGLAHQMIPKQATGISRKSPEQHLEFAQENNKKFLILDADTLVEHFKSALQKFKKDLDDNRKDKSGIYLTANVQKSVDEIVSDSSELPKTSGSRSPLITFPPESFEIGNEL